MRRKRVGFAPGVFDLFHVGHLNILRQARAHCDHLIAGVHADDTVLQMKGRAPVVPLSERLEIVKSVRFVDEAVPVSEPDKIKVWKSLGFDVVFKGDDWRGTETWNALEEKFGKLGVDVVYFPYTLYTSSTLLRSVLTHLNSQAPAASGSGQFPVPLHEKGGQEEGMSHEQSAVQPEKEMLASQE